MTDSLRRLADSVLGISEFGDCRSRKMVLVPHCALNQNARAAGAAERPAALAELVRYLLEKEIGILQMPCPEIYAFGLDRGQIRIEIEFRTPSGRALSRRLARDLASQIRMYRDHGIAVLGILGKDGSPSCGVEETWSGGVCPGAGAFIEELKATLAEQRISIPVAGIRDSEPGRAIETVQRWLADRSCG